MWKILKINPKGDVETFEDEIVNIECVKELVSDLLEDSKNKYRIVIEKY